MFNSANYKYVPWDTLFLLGQKYCNTQHTSWLGELRQNIIRVINDYSGQSLCSVKQ
jgi:hypothetical protein